MGMTSNFHIERGFNISCLEMPKYSCISIKIEDGHGNSISIYIQKDQLFDFLDTLQTATEEREVIE